MSMDEEYDNLVDMLIELGALEIIGYDVKSNQFTYGITEKCKEIAPALYDEHFKAINALAFKLWQDGVVEMQFDTDGVPAVMLTDMAVEIKDTLPDEERFFIESLIKKHRER